MKASERYLLDELDREERDQFEEHLFDCQECAIDVRAGAMFIEQTKVILAEAPATTPAAISAPQSKPGWFAWLRPAFAVPAMAVLLAVIGYQNLVLIPHQELAASQPQLLAMATVNVSTRGASTTQVTIKPGQGVSLNVNIPPDSAYSSYTLELHNPAGALQWSLKIPASSPDDTRSITIPGAGLVQGTYNLMVSGITAAAQSTNLGTYPVELQIQQ